MKRREFLKRFALGTTAVAGAGFSCFTSPAAASPFSTNRGPVPPFKYLPNGRAGINEEYLTAPFEIRIESRSDDTVEWRYFKEAYPFRFRTAEDAEYFMRWMAKRTAPMKTNPNPALREYHARIYSRTITRMAETTGCDSR